MSTPTCTIQVINTHSGRHLTLNGAYLAGAKPSGTTYAVASFCVPLPELEKRLASISTSYSVPVTDP